MGKGMRAGTCGSPLEWMTRKGIGDWADWAGQYRATFLKPVCCMKWGQWPELGTVKARMGSHWRLDVGITSRVSGMGQAWGQKVVQG